jgi:TetR/AcrR family transcriptional regulator, transcriptional repressor for nem operon
MIERTSRGTEGHARILASAGRGFRQHGFGGLGVDALAKGAGVTSGAFYAHFPSKAVAFREAVVAGLRDLRHGIAQVRAEAGRGWIAGFVEFYMTTRRLCPIEESCAVQSLTAEVERSGPETRAAFTTELRGILDAMSEDGSRDQAIAVLSLVVGGATLARAVDDPVLGDEIADAIRAASRRIAPG